MIKRSLGIFIAAVLCVITVFGTGFALWSFNSQSADSQDMGVRITQSSVMGVFVAPQISHVVLDGGTGAGLNPTITGVSFYKGDDSGNAVTDNDFIISFTLNEKFKAQFAQDGEREKIQFGIRIEVPDSLKGLISHTDFYNSRVRDDGYIDLKALAVELTDHFDDNGYDNSDFNYDAENGVFTFALTTTTLNRFFTYSPAKEPDTLGKYESLGGNFAPYMVIELWQGYAETA